MTLDEAKEKLSHADMKLSFFPSLKLIEESSVEKCRYWYDRLPMAGDDSESMSSLMMAKKIGNHTMPRYKYPVKYKNYISDEEYDKL